MQDENIMKMAERADTEIKDVPTLNILLCYLLYKIDRPVSPDQLYDIAIGTGVVNYFYYQDSIGYLLKNGHITLEKGDELILYTDGVINVCAPGGRRLGSQGFINILASNIDKDADSQLSDIISDIASFKGMEPSKDDMTIMLLRYQGL